MTVGPPLHEARVHSKSDAGGGLTCLALQAPHGLAPAYVRAGQYVALEGGRRTSYFVLASDPGEPIWELLVRAGGEVADAALSSTPGARMRVSAPLGPGFPMEEASELELIVVVTGSGIAAARPVVRTRLKVGRALDTELLVGVRTVNDVPLRDELDAWRAGGVRVTVCLSRGEPPKVEGYTSGYVQDVARRHARAAPTKRRLIFAAGVKPMIAGVRALARDLHVHESDVRTNY